MVDPLVETVQLSTKPLTNTGETSMHPWKQGLVAPQAAATGLHVPGLAQWVFLYMINKEKSLLRAWPNTHEARENFFLKVTLIILVQNKTMYWLLKVFEIYIE